MKSGSRIIILTAASNGVTSKDLESVAKRLTHGKKKMLCFSFCSEEPMYREILGEGETVASTLFCKQLEEVAARVPTGHRVGQNPAPGGQREITSCENHPAKAEELRYGMATSSTLFPRCLSMRFPCISEPGKLLQRRWIATRLQDFWRRGLEQMPERWRTLVRTRGK